MFWLIKKIFIGLLASIVNAFNHTNCISLNNQQCMAQPTLINLQPNQYSQECCYYLWLIWIDVREVAILLMISI